MILANRAVIFFKIKEFKWAIQDLILSIETGKYPTENMYKLYQRLAKSYEYLKSFELAAVNHKKIVETVDLSNLPKAQKLQVKNDAQKRTGVCKKMGVAQSFVSLDSNKKLEGHGEFPKYKSSHREIQNASGTLSIYQNISLSRQ